MSQPPRNPFPEFPWAKIIPFPPEFDGAELALYSYYIELIRHIHIIETNCLQDVEEAKMSRDEITDSVCELLGDDFYIHHDMVLFELNGKTTDPQPFRLERMQKEFKSIKLLWSDREECLRRFAHLKILEHMKTIENILKYQTTKPPNYVEKDHSNNSLWAEKQTDDWDEPSPSSDDW